MAAKHADVLAVPAETDDIIACGQIRWDNDVVSNLTGHPITRADPFDIRVQTSRRGATHRAPWRVIQRIVRHLLASVRVELAAAHTVCWMGAVELVRI